MVNNERENNNYNFLRLFAAICITFSHSFDLLNNSNAEPLYNLTNHTINFSFIGLCIFFSCSGYLIAKSADTSASLKNYIFKRFLRIQPLLIVWCCVAVFIVGVLFSTLSFKDYFTSKETWTYFRTIMPLFGIQFQLPQVFLSNPIDTGVNGSLWTLIVEERLYLLMALCFVFKKNKKLLFIFFILLLNIIYLLNSFISKEYKILALDTSANYYALCFLNASLLYFVNIKFSKNISAILIGSFIASLLSIYVTPLNSLEVLFIPLFIIGVAHLKTVTNKMGRYGDYTYGIYMFSFPVQQILIATKLVDTSYVLFFVTLLIVVPIAFISWHYFEKPLLSLKNKVV